MSPEEIPGFLEQFRRLPDGVLRGFVEPWTEWKNWARPEQLEPDGAWRTWLVSGGRGYGKTRTGSETTQNWAQTGQMKRGALVGRTAGDARDVMVEGPSGILAIAPPWARPTYYPSKRRLVWHTLRDVLGFEPMATIYSADKPDLLRGPEHDRAWADELAAWRHFSAWSNLQFGLRQGDRPRAIVTTTPKPTAVIKKLYARASTGDGKVVISGGSTFDNAANLADEAMEEWLEEYAHTELGKQELFAQLLTEAEGALWQRSWIDDARITEKNEDGAYAIPEFDAMVVAVDPAVSTKKTSSETGIIVVGRKMQIDDDGKQRNHYYIVDDVSGRMKPHAWATAAVDARQWYEADYIVGETNNGGDLVGYTVETVDPEEMFKEVKASIGKRPRAHPVAAASAQGRLHMIGEFAELEDQLCTWIPGDESPDRLDAMVWGVIELTPKKTRKMATEADFDFDSLRKPSYFRGERSV